MKTWHCLVTASLILLMGCGGGLKGSLPRDDSRQTHTLPDADALINEELVKFDVPIQMNKQVQAYLVYFSTERKEIIRRQLARSTQYLTMIKEIFQEYGLPEDLAYLAMIESGFNPNAVSPAGACGMWQFIKGTGLRYGLVINDHLDERRDPEKSTRAAARYLLDLYKRFGSWYLAAASYNCGEGRVQQELRKGNHRNFWELSANKCLPNETKNYVPQMIAATIIAKNPEKFGFTNPPAIQPPDATMMAVAEPSKNLARVSNGEVASQPHLTAKAPILSSAPVRGQSSAQNHGVPKSMADTRGNGKSTQKRLTQVACTKNRKLKAPDETSHPSVPHTASLFGTPWAAPPQEMSGKNKRHQRAAADLKGKKIAQVKSSKGKKQSPALLARRHQTTGPKANPGKKGISPTAGHKGKMAKTKSKALLVSDAR